MRIIAGTARGRRLKAPRGDSVRPTADRAREALFSILATRIAGARVFDLCAGTGAVGLEALSRGAELAIFVERDRAALEALRANVAACGAADRSAIHETDVVAFLEGAGRPGPRDLVFADPPWAGDLGERILALLGGAPPGLFVLEHDSRRPPAPGAGSLGLLRTVVHGDTGLSFYENTGPP